ncbi:hypothetical protein [Massilia sp. NP310]|uniref:hypothetical protein n=1 Tax=Massilia sp. NP310 TaxID=2861282 RepID=UPI001C626189|nr:hypothetical protein [Massilia sp. NP310]QYG00163.1 hypothetical protein KY496_17420 [Massilia sp. NP310]
MNNILANAIASITLGIEDYKSEGRHRPLSALRNISAGILLLFKAKLARLAPDETLIKKDFQLAWQDGRASWTAKGDKTIDYHGIQERFKLVGIRFNFKEMDRIISQRNRIEHYVADVPVEALRESIANAVNLINRFCREQMDVEAASLFDPDIWQMVLQEKAIHDVEKNACNDRMGQMNWPYPELLNIAVDHYLCGTCDGDLVSPVDPGAPLREVRFACAACGAAEGYASAMEAAFLSWAAIENCRSIKYGGEAVNDDCEKCMSDLVLASRGYCVACGYEHFKRCDGCGQVFQKSHFCESCDYADGLAARIDRSSLEES